MCWEWKLWTYHCPHCEEGFGDLEGKVIKRQYDGFGDRYTLLKCPRCGKLVITGPGGCEELVDKVWWELSEQEWKELGVEE